MSAIGVSAASRILAFTSSGVVEQVTPISKKDLDHLASWLCVTACACENSTHYQRQITRNGYCDSCRDIAGSLLSEFEVKPRQEVRSRA